MTNRQESGQRSAGSPEAATGIHLPRLAFLARAHPSRTGDGRPERHPQGAHHGRPGRQGTFPHPSDGRRRQRRPGAAAPAADVDRGRDRVRADGRRLVNRATTPKDVLQLRADYGRSWTVRMLHGTACATRRRDLSDSELGAGLAMTLYDGDRESLSEQLIEQTRIEESLSSTP